MGRAAAQRHPKSRFNMPYPTLTAFNMFKCMSIKSGVQVLFKRDLGQRNTGRIWRVWSIAASRTHIMGAAALAGRREDGDHDRRSQRS
jgi:hypothetical protein